MFQLTSVINSQPEPSNSVWQTCAWRHSYFSIPHVSLECLTLSQLHGDLLRPDKLWHITVAMHPQDLPSMYVPLYPHQTSLPHSRCTLWLFASKKKQVPCLRIALTSFNDGNPKSILSIGKTLLTTDKAQQLSGTRYLLYSGRIQGDDKQSHTFSLPVSLSAKHL